MFSAKDVPIYIGVDDIFSKISEYDIFKSYCPHFKELNVAFLSEFYDDKNPDCYISQDNNNHLFYKDFGEKEHRFSCVYYVMFKYSITFKEALLVISNDFNLSKIDSNIRPNFLLGKDYESKVLIPRIKPIITIAVRNWDNIDYNYWSKYGIELSMLDKYDVFPCSHVYLHKGEKTIIFNSTKDNPIYAYRFEYEGKYRYKGYKP